MSNQDKYLRLYPVHWPVFSTKNYVKDQDGWWNYQKNKKYKKVFNQNYN
jgi:hypothetical protein